jgi:hypothetical protein
LNLRGNLPERVPDYVARQQLQEVKNLDLQPDGAIARDISSWNGHK